MVERDSSQMNIVTTSKSLARLLWWYGEDELWRSALELSAQQVADLSPQFARLYLNPDQIERVWQNAPSKSAYFLVPMIELFEGEPRPAALRRRRPQSKMPISLVEHGGWTDPMLHEVADILQSRRQEHSP